MTTRMKLIIALVLFPAFCFSQPLGEISTKDQAEQLITDKFKIVGYKYDSFAIDSPSPIFDTFGKADLDHDGEEDLLVFGTAYVTVDGTAYEEDEIVIILGDKKSPTKVSFPYSFFRGLGVHIIPYPKIIKFDSQDYLLIQYDLTDYENGTSKTYKDTLFVAYDHIMPYNDAPDSKVVTRIEFKTDYCFGSCPVFEISIDKNLDATYNGIDHVSKKGEYNLKASKRDWGYLSELIALLNVDRLKDSYYVNWTDDQTAYLTVYFQDGSKKQIEDYGLTGTFGLSVLYDYFFDLRDF
jgi:hypothetical protein